MVSVRWGAIAVVLVASACGGTSGVHVGMASGDASPETQGDSAQGGAGAGGGGSLGAGGGAGTGTGAIGVAGTGGGAGAGGSGGAMGGSGGGMGGSSGGGIGGGGASAGSSGGTSTGGSAGGQDAGGSDAQDGSDAAPTDASSGETGGSDDAGPRLPCAPIVADSRTVVLDHMDGATIGVGQGALTFTPDLPGLGKAVALMDGTYIRYDPRPWVSGGRGAGADPMNQGTIEFCLYLETSGPMFEINWNLESSYPPAGHVLQMSLDDAGHLAYGVWNFERCDSGANPCYPTGLTGSSVIPAGQWVHVAVTWSPSHSALYVAGVPEAAVDTNVYADFSGLHAYLNLWGTNGFQGMVDEFQISNIARSESDIRRHAGLTP